MLIHNCDLRWPLWLLVGSMLTPPLVHAQGLIQGQVVDPLGAAVIQAKVALLRGAAVVATTETTSAGSFEFASLAASRYNVHVEASGFEPQDSPPVQVADERAVRLQVMLRIGPLRQQIVVSATGTALSAFQVGASVSVIDRQELESLNKFDAFEALRLMPGVQAVPTGQHGGTTSLFVRGGDGDFNKVLIDGIPANDIGGGFEFSDLATNGLDSLELMRGPNSVLYGSDALASVVNLSTRRGTSTTPEVSYAVDGGNFHTLFQAVSLAGAYRRFDYFSEFGRFDTKDGVPNSSFHNGTVSGNFGWQATSTTGIRLTLRHTATGAGDPNAVGSFGVADDSFQREQNTYLGLTIQNQTTPRWHNLLRLTSTDLRFKFDNPAPTGTAFDPFGFGSNYLGDLVTLEGANGYTTTGRAILDYGGDYPQLFHSSTTVRSLYTQSDYAFAPNLTGTLGFRYDHESGFTQEVGSPRSATVRNNFDYFLEAHGSLRHSLYGTAGLGLDSNAVFGFAATPRVSLAWYPRQPSSAGLFTGTKLRFNFGQGIKEPSISDEGSSLFELLSTLPNGMSLIHQFNVAPVGAERSRSFDFGVEQWLWSSRARLGLTIFHERFYDLIAFVSKSALPDLGVPPSVAGALPFGAAVNSDSFRSQGAEIEAQASLTTNLMARASYTYLDSVVTQSLASSALSPQFNPAFPAVPIGVFSPLVGSRPFHRPPHTASFAADYSRRRFGATLSGYLVSLSDDSTFLTDGYFGTSMLLPNRNLLNGYQLLDLSMRFTPRREVTLYASVGNLLSERYQSVFGYPALPLTVRAGVRFTLGGENSKWR